MAIAFRTHHGTYLTAEKDSKRVAGNRTAVAAWEKFSLERVSDTQVALRTSFGTYLTAEGGGGQHVACDRTSVQPWETFGYWIREDGRVSIQAENGQWLRVGSADEGYPVTCTKDGEPEAYETFSVEEVADEPGQQPGINPRPMQGRLCVHGNFEAFGDDSGPRADLYIVHMGDLVPRWMYGKLRGDSGQLDECFLDLDDSAAAGGLLLRSWWYLDHHPPGSVWHSHKYEGLDHRIIGDERFVAWGIELVNEVAARGMRICIGPGGVGERNGILDSEEEAHMFRLFRRIADGAGHEKVAWGEGSNEASSGGTSDQTDDSRATGDNSPGNLDRLVQILIGGTDILGHLSYWTNNNYLEAARYLAAWQWYNQVHSWRNGNVFNKIDRHFTWCRVFVEQTGRANGRLTMDTEGPGAPADAPGVPGDRLTMVSATDNGHELNNPEAIALIAAATAVRGIPTLMSGNGVRRYQRFTEVVGWREVPWTLAQFWPDLHTFELRHGGQSHPHLVFKATTNSNGVLARADQATSRDGRRCLAILYNQHADQHQDFPVLRGGHARILDTRAMQVTEQRIHAGGTLPMDATWGRIALVDVD